MHGAKEEIPFKKGLITANIQGEDSITTILGLHNKFPFPFLKF
jgi:hypothetical protein